MRNLKFLPAIVRALPWIVLSLGAWTQAKSEEGQGVTFNLPEPQTKNLERLNLYSTFYHVWAAEESTAPGAVTVLLTDGKPGPQKVTKRDWCKGSMEGTLRVAAGKSIHLYNMADRKGPFQVDCTEYFKEAAQKNPGLIVKIAHNRFVRVKSTAPFGLGVNNLQLVPYRTVAVDKPYIGSVIYIPALRGKEFVNHDGVKRRHDGYVYGGDTGDLIKGSHIDFFSGLTSENPFPDIIRSDPSATFTAYRVPSPEIRKILKDTHKQPTAPP